MLVKVDKSDFKERNTDKLSNKVAKLWLMSIVSASLLIVCENYSLKKNSIHLPSHSFLPARDATPICRTQ